MKNTHPTTIRLTAKCREYLLEIQKQNPNSDLAHSQVIEKALLYYRIFPQPISINAEEERAAAMVFRTLHTEAVKLEKGSRQNEPDSGSLSLAFRSCAFVLKRVILQAKGRLIFKNHD